MQRGVFRKVALDRLSSPEELDQMVTVVSPVGWIALAVTGVLLSSAIVWSIIGTLPVTVQGFGSMWDIGELSYVTSGDTVRVDRLYVEAGDVVREGQVIARISQTGIRGGQSVNSPSAGRVSEVIVAEGQVLQAGNPLLSLEEIASETEASLRGIFYLLPADGKKIQPGMNVLIAPSTAKPQEFGYMEGTVIAVSSFAPTSQELQDNLGNSRLIESITQEGPPIKVTVDLEQDAQTVSGYKWTSDAGPPISIDSGTRGSINVIVENERPIYLVFEWLKTIGS